MIQGLSRFATSLAGRITLLMAIGSLLGSIVALLVAERAREAEFRRVRDERVLASAADVLARLERDHRQAVEQLRQGQLVGAQFLNLPGGRARRPDPSLTLRLRARVGGALSPAISEAPSEVCLREMNFSRLPRAAGFVQPPLPDCWLLTVSLPSEDAQIAIDLPQLPNPPSATTDPLFLGLVATAAVLLSLVVAHLATTPLRRLSAATDAFARSIDAEPVAETGPHDVRTALSTFNLMQARVREGLRERTRILAAISHDLQTPLTRLRLRIEQVENKALREKLTADLSATLTMVRRGLELARSGESAEEWAVVDLDSLIASMVDDAVEFGQPVQLLSVCGVRVRVRPDALTRCLQNLVDNAVKYGGGAELSCHRCGRYVMITVRDHGPGMDAALLARAFEPFVRGDDRRAGGSGAGIGLAIARAQAAAIGGELTLANHPAGGVAANLRLSATG